MATLRSTFRYITGAVFSGVLGVTTAWAACPAKPNIILFVADDLDWTALPFVNPALRPELLDTAAEIAATAIDRARPLQSPTMNRLDARLCAVAGTGAFGACAGASEFEVAPADRVLNDLTSPPPYSDGACEFEAPPASCDVTRDVIPGYGGLERIARDGFFYRFYATSAKCIPTRASMMTGRPGTKTGSNGNAELEKLEAHEISIAEYLQQRCNVNRCFTADGACPSGLPPESASVCYTTGMIGKWHSHKTSPNREGFDEAITFSAQQQDPMDETKGPSLDCHPKTLNLDEISPGIPADPPLGHCVATADGGIYHRSGTDVPGVGSDDNCWDTTSPARSAGEDPKGCPFTVRIFTDLAVNFIDRHKGDPQPFFLLITFPAVHDPHRAPTRTARHYETLDRHVRPPRPSPYWAMIEEMDAGIGRILSKLDTHNLLEETLLLFTSDQGPDGSEMVYGDPKLRGRKGTVYERGIRVPFLARACVLDENVRQLATAHPVSHVDLFRTIADFAGLPVSKFPRGGELCACETPDRDADYEGGSCALCPVEEHHFRDIDGTSFYGVLQSGTAHPNAVRQRDFVFARWGTGQLAVSTREGYYIGHTLPNIGQAKGRVCGLVGPETSATDHMYPRVRAASCTPCATNSDCQNVSDCEVLGRWCESPPPPEDPLALHERARCKLSSQCRDPNSPSNEKCERDVDESAENITCGQCIKAAWKLVTKGSGRRVFDLATNPEEDDLVNCFESSEVNPRHPEVLEIQKDLDQTLERWNASLLWDRCGVDVECPSPAQGGPDNGCASCCIGTGTDCVSSP